MNVRRMILLVAVAALAARAGADDGSAQQPPGAPSRPWYRKDAQKAQELGERGTSAAKRGASRAGKKLNEGGQAAAAKVAGTRTVAGRLTAVSPEQVTVERTDGTPLTLRVPESTKVTVDGEKAAAGSLREGDPVRASYVQSGGSATAMKIDVERATPGSSGSRSPASGGAGAGSR